MIMPFHPSFQADSGSGSGSSGDCGTATAAPPDECGFYAAYKRVHAAAGTRTQVELAAVLHVRQSAISDAKRKKRIPAEWLRTLLTTHRTAPKWILCGICPREVPQDTVLDPATVNRLIQEAESA